MGSSDALALKACGQATVDRVKNAINIVRGAAQIYMGDFGGADALGAGLQAELTIAINTLTGEPDKYPWAAYAIAQAEEGVFLMSAADVYPWYYVTHKSPACSGKGRNTTGMDAKRMAKNLGFLLGTPRLRDLNNFTVANLKQFNQDLKAQGMDGLDPLWDDKWFFYGFNAIQKIETTETPFVPTFTKETGRALMSQLRFGGDIINRSNFTINPTAVKKIVADSKKTQLPENPATALTVGAILALLYFS